MSISFPRKNPKLLAADLLDACSPDSVNEVDAADRAAYWLFTTMLARGIPVERAKRIYARYSTPLSATKMAEIKNAALLSRLDWMKPTPNVQKLARELAEENRTLPTRERHGPRGTTNVSVLDKHLRRLVRRRTDLMKAGKWWGPFPP